MALADVSVFMIRASYAENMAESRYGERFLRRCIILNQGSSTFLIVLIVKKDQGPPFQMNMTERKITWAISRNLKIPAQFVATFKGTLSW